MKQCTKILLRRVVTFCFKSRSEPPLSLFTTHYHHLALLSFPSVRGSYSARVPKSSLASVHREFVHHILEDEVDGQEEGQDDKREDGQQREESGVVEESEQTHEDDTWCAHDKHTTWAAHVRVNQWENTTCEVWVFALPVGCSRLLSAVKDLTAKNWKIKFLNVDTSEVVWRNGTTGLHVLSCCALHTWAHLWTFLLIITSSTRNRSTATKMCWMKKTMDAIAGIARKESARVALLRTLGEDGTQRFVEVRTISHRSNFSRFIEWDPPILFCIESTHLPSFDRWNPSARPCPSGCRLLQFDQCWFEIHEIWNLFGSDRESLQILSWCISFSNYGQCGVVFVLQSSHIDGHEVAPSWWHNFELREGPRYIGWRLGWLLKKAFFALRFRICLAQHK